MIKPITKIAVGMTASLLALSANAGLIEIYETDSGMGSIAAAQAVIDAATGADYSADISSIWYSDTGDVDWFGLGVGTAWPGGVDMTFVASISGTIDTNRYSHIMLAHDDGASLSVDGAVAYEFGAPTDFRTSGALALGGAAGNQAISGIYYENAGEADLLLAGLRRDGSGWEIAQVPEPTTLTLLALGLFGAGFAKRRRGVQVK